jgi:tetratricopeptide (TPR) repeat protein
MDRNKSIAKRKYYINILKKYLGPNEPDRLRAIYCSNIARAYSFIGEHKKGLNYLKKAIEFDPKLTAIYFDLGNNAIFRKAYFEAIKWLEKAISLDNKRPEYYISAAQAYTFLGNLIEAFEMMQRCLAVDPQNPIALNFISEISAKGIL